jgi:hypothetical protein
MEHRLNRLIASSSLIIGVIIAATSALVDCSGSDSGGYGGSYYYGAGTGVGGATGSGGNSGIAGNPPKTFTAIYTSIISARCLSCHANSGPGISVGMLEMSSQELAYANLVGPSGTGEAAKGTAAGSSNTTCASVPELLRVTPGSAATSLLWEKVSAKLEGANAPCGNPMPASGAALTRAEVDAIGAWIDAGAAND